MAIKLDSWLEFLLDCLTGSEEGGEWGVGGGRWQMGGGGEGGGGGASIKGPEMIVPVDT